MDNNKQVAVSRTQQIANESGMTREQVDLIKDTVAKGATDDELRFFLQVAHRGGLDPFARQVYMVKRKNWDAETRTSKEVMTVQMGIDGFRAQAQATGEYAGSDDAEFGPMQEATFESKSGGGKYKHPEWAKVSVWGKNDVRPTSATVYWDEFYPGDPQGHMWRKMPRQMLSKVAEAQALRKRFPKALSGLYASEEMEQANETPQLAAEQQEKQEIVQLNEQGQPLATENQVKIMYIRATEKGYSREEVHKIMESKFGVSSGKDLTREQAETMIKGFDKIASKGDKPAPKSDNPDVQSELESLEGEVMAAKIPDSKKVKLTEEEEVAAEAKIAKYKNREAE